MDRREEVKKKIASVTGGLDMNCSDMEESMCLYDAAKAVPAGSVIVEFGSWKGRSTTALALGSMDGAGVDVYSVDPHDKAPIEGEEIAEYDRYDLCEWMEASLEHRTWEVVKPVTLYSDVFIRAFLDALGIVGLLFIDASHEYEPTHVEAFGMLPLLTPEAKIIFDDYPYEGVRQVCDELEDEGWTVKPWGAKLGIAYQPGAEVWTPQIEGA